MTPKGRARDKKERTMRTTVDLPDEVWRALKVRAVDERTDMRSVIIAALEAHLRLPKRKGG